MRPICALIVFAALAAAGQACAQGEIPPARAP